MSLLVFFYHNAFLVIFWISLTSEYFFFAWKLNFIYSNNQI